MSQTGKYQTNPVVIDATGYGPYAEKRAAEASKKGRCTKAARAAAASRFFWIQENARKSVHDYLRHNQNDLFRSKWECTADKKGLYSRVQWEMDKINERQQVHLDKRREKLKKLLEDEQDKYFNEEKNNVISNENKREAMLARYTNIMSQKEQQRQEIVKAKTEQQFRMNCDELRTKISEKVCRLVTAEGKSLAEQKNHLTREQDLVDKMYEEAWKKDAEAKAKCEQEYENRRKLRDLEYGKYIKERIKGRNVPEYDIPDKDHDRNLMEENDRLAKIEAEWEKMQKKMKQERLKKDLDECLKNKLARKAKEIQQDLMLDLYFLEQMTFADVEKQQADAKKKTLRKEQEGYLSYLREQIKKEAEFETDLEKRFKEENDKMWDKKEAQWEAERKMRETHNKRIIEECKEQMRNQMEKCLQVERMKKEYDEEIKKQAEIDRGEKEEQRKFIREKNVQNQKELLDQIKQREEQAKEVIAEKQIELDNLRKAREEFDRKLEQVLAETKIDNIHPARSKPKPCCCTTTE